mgnify:CR=1 FL=1|jgi:hypothetical protein
MPNPIMQCSRPAVRDGHARLAYLVRIPIQKAAAKIETQNKARSHIWRGRACAPSFEARRDGKGSPVRFHSNPTQPVGRVLTVQAAAIAKCQLDKSKRQTLQRWSGFGFGVSAELVDVDRCFGMGYSNKVGHAQAIPHLGRIGRLVKGQGVSAILQELPDFRNMRLA